MNAKKAYQKGTFFAVAHPDFVTGKYQAGTSCHDNLGYYFRKPLIAQAEPDEANGPSGAVFHTGGQKVKLIMKMQ